MTNTKCDLCGKEGGGMYSLRELGDLVYDAANHELYGVVEVCYECKDAILIGMQKAKTYIERRLTPSFLRYTLVAIMKAIKDKQK
jgi:hypothetical protein